MITFCIPPKQALLGRVAEAQRFKHKENQMRDAVVILVLGGLILAYGLCFRGDVTGTEPQRAKARGETDSAASSPPAMPFEAPPKREVSEELPLRESLAADADSRVDEESAPSDEAPAEEDSEFAHLESRARAELAGAHFLA